MTCRHAKGDPNCSGTPGSAAHDAIYSRRGESEPKTPDSTKYEIEYVTQVGPHLVVKVKYPNCRACSYEGSKVMVYLHVTPLAAMRWRQIDPHFVEPGTCRGPTQAPGPDARFPASTAGWADALAYAKSKS